MAQASRRTASFARIRTTTPEVPISGLSELVSSDSVGWTSLRLRLTEISTDSDEYESPQVKDLAAHIFLNDQRNREVFASGRWRPIEMDRGRIATTPAGETWRLRYNNRKRLNKHRLIHLYIPQPTFEAVVQQLPQSLTAGRRAAHLAVVRDEALSHFASSLVGAIEAGASNVYAQASAHWLSTHLFLGSERTAEWAATMERQRISDVRLLRVLECVKDRLSDDLSLEVLASEAGLSQFQFTTLFQRAMGKSLHKHVLHLRMDNAALLLRETKRTVLEIAVLCGYKTASHFAVAFRKHFAQSPTEYRFAQKGKELGILDHFLS